MKAVPLPPLVGQMFLAGDGFVGLRCDCGFVATARTPHALDFALREHQRFRHLRSDEALLDTECTEGSEG
jgi:hypothetical protein